MQVVAVPVNSEIIVYYIFSYQAPGCTGKYKKHGYKGTGIFSQHSRLVVFRCAVPDRCCNAADNQEKIKYAHGEKAVKCHISGSIEKYFSGFLNLFRNSFRSHILLEIFFLCCSFHKIHLSDYGLAEFNSFVFSEYKGYISFIRSGHTVCVHFDSGCAHNALEKVTLHVDSRQVFNSYSVVQSV